MTTPFAQRRGRANASAEYYEATPPYLFVLIYTYFHLFALNYICSYSLIFLRFRTYSSTKCPFCTHL